MILYFLQHHFCQGGSGYFFHGIGRGCRIDPAGNGCFRKDERHAVVDPAGLPNGRPGKDREERIAVFHAV